MTKMVTRVALLAALCMLGGNTVLAQLQSGRIVGTVYRPAEGGHSRRDCHRHERRDERRHEVPSPIREGNYVITPLDPGTYNVSAEMPGFQKTVRERARR